MKPGPKPVPRADKIQRGTLQPSRDVTFGKAVVMASNPPLMPDYLSPAAQEVWIEDIGRVMLHGVDEQDSSLFGRYCSTEALVREAFKGGFSPPAAYLTELRRMAELLGIAGPRVRSGGKPGGQKSNSENPFTRNGNRPQP